MNPTINSHRPPHSSPHLTYYRRLKAPPTSPLVSINIPPTIEQADHQLSTTSPSPSSDHPFMTPPLDPPTSAHPMTTRAKAGVTKLATRLNLHSTSTPPISHIPKSVSIARSDPNFLLVMEDEFNAL